jgi:Ca2+-transporting ATPase
MITGDHPIMARAIARRLGILHSDQQKILTGTELMNMQDETLNRKVENTRVYARVAPAQKLKIVRALQEKNQFVAMTGDGVNDAPALKRANIGIAMGITGTQVSKEASHMILLNDNFATIIRAIEEGRRIFDNIRKFIKFILSCNFAEIWAVFLAPCLGLPIPLLPIQILWINLVTDSLPALALATEPAERGIMERPPRDPKEGLLARGLGPYIFIVGLLMAAVTLSIQFWAIKTGRPWQTMTFTVLCLSQMGNALAIRSEKTTLFAHGVFSNLYLIGAVGMAVLLQMATVYVPFMNNIFKTQPLTLSDLTITVIASGFIFMCVEIWKGIRKKAS